MIGSLGEALAGVTLGSHPGPNRTFSFHNEHDSGTPFNLRAQANGNNGELSGGWSFNNDTNAQPNVEEKQAPPHDSSTANNMTGNQGINLFLSQSPSQMLGNGVFKLSSNNLAGLDMPQEDTSGDPFRQQPIGQASPAFQASQGHKNESPSNLTGTTSSSRSGSPHHNADGGRSIKAYHGYDVANATTNNEVTGQAMPSFQEANVTNNFAPVQGGVTGSAIGPNMVGIQSNYPSNFAEMGAQPYGAFVPGDSAYNGESTTGFDHSKHVINPGHIQQQAPLQQGQPQQVLYMAVPTPDGRGQVLQPVQMVQLPGKPFAYVLPGQPGGIPVMQPAITGLDPTQPPMMAMPNMQIQQPPLLQPSDVMSNIGVPRNGSGQGRDYGIAPKSDPYAESPRTAARGGGGKGYVATDPDDPLAALYNSPERPPLDALLGQVRRLSRDQVGCRLVQQALDEEGTNAATLILNEGLPFWGEAMVDPFGNYLFQKILEKITSEERTMLIKTVSPRLVNASLNLHGTRSVQKIVELCAQDEEKNKTASTGGEETSAHILTSSLASAAARLCIDSHGNHVIQRILLKLELKYSKFVFDAVAESVEDVARHRHGCCVIQRCLDSPPCPARSHLVSRIVAKSLELMQDAYGNYVIQYVLDVCSDEDVQAVCESVVGKVTLLAIQKFSSNVMEKCLERCSDRAKEEYLIELSDSERIRELMMDPFGNYVVQRALSVSSHAQAVRLVEAMKPHLMATPAGGPNGHRNGGVRNTAGGRRIMVKICRRFPNFNLNGMGTNEELYSQNKSHHRHNNNHHHQQNGGGHTGHYGQIPPQHHMPQQQQLPHQHTYQQQRYNMNPQAMGMDMHQQQFDPHHPAQPYFGIGVAGYFQHSSNMPNMANMGNDAFPRNF